MCLDRIDIHIPIQNADGGKEGHRGLSLMKSKMVLGEAHASCNLLRWKSWRLLSRTNRLPIRKLDIMERCVRSAANLVKDIRLDIREFPRPSSNMNVSVACFRRLKHEMQLDSCRQGSTLGMTERERGYTVNYPHFHTAEARLDRTLADLRRWKGDHCWCWAISIVAPAWCIICWICCPDVLIILTCGNM